MKYLIFYLLTWEAYDVPVVESLSDEDDENNNNNNNKNSTLSKLYKIYLFGRTLSGKSVCIQVDDFCPYFYIKLPERWQKSHCNQLYTDLKSSLFFVKDEFVSYKIVQKKDALGYHHETKYQFMKVSFCSKSTMYAAMKQLRYCQTKPMAKYLNRNIKFKIYHGNVNPILAFMHERRIPSCGWIKVQFKTLHDNNECEDEFNFSHQSDYCISTNYTKISYDDNDEEMKKQQHLLPPISILSFDIECYSESGHFPDPKKPRDYITQIGSSVSIFSSTSTSTLSETETKTTSLLQQSVVVYGDCDLVENVKIISCKNEREVLLRWCKDIVCKSNPDIIIGYNIDGFDWRYIGERSKLLQIHDQMCSLMTRLLHFSGKFETLQLMSKLSRGRERQTLNIPGITQIDLYTWFQGNEKLDHYTLDHVSETFLGEKKREIKPREILEMTDPIHGTAKSRSIIADYCAQDTALPIKLLYTKKILLNLMEMAKCTYVPLEWLITRGQQIKVFSQFLLECFKFNYLLPSELPKNENEGYEGATVLECTRGMHSHCSGLDFASLYPTIIIANNLCLTTIVLDPVFDNLPGVKYNTFQLSETSVVKFVDRSYKQGILPNILYRLRVERTRTKKEMENASSKQMYDILNGKQLAIKVSMNSIYGCLGAKQGQLALNKIAETVTHCGRNLIKQCKDWVETKYDGSESVNGITGTVLYGDSVRGTMPVTICYNKRHIMCRRIDELNVTNYNYMQHRLMEHDKSSICSQVIIDKEKQEAQCAKDMLVYTDEGWRSVRRLIRHRMNEKKKKLYRVVTNRGIVEVTEDHSLLLQQKNHEGQYIIVKPTEIQLGDILASRFISTRVKGR